MTGFYQPQPDSSHSGYKQTEYDNLSDEELAALINATGRARVAPQRRPPAKGYVDLDALIERSK
jgi:hypothetical protein